MKTSELLVTVPLFCLVSPLLFGSITWSWPHATTRGILPAGNVRRR